jgi:Beta-propeller repeat
MILASLLGQPRSSVAFASTFAMPVAPSNLGFSTYIGASGNDEGYMVAAASDGGAYAVGILRGTGVHVTSYVIHFSSSGSLLWSTSISASGDVTAYYVRANAGAVYVVGVTKAPNMPDATNLDPAPTSGTGFITVIDPATGSVRSSTYLGAAGFSAANVDALDPVTGNVYVGMSTSSQTRLLMLEPTGTHILWSRLLGGAGASTHPYGMQADSSGNLLVATLTNSLKYPVVNAFQSTYGGGNFDVGITKLTPSGRITWSTYLGGSATDRPNGLDIDQSGNVYVAGRTYSRDFPLQSAQNTSNQDGDAAFVTSFMKTGAMRYSTYIGGNSSEWFGGVAVAPDGTAWAVGGSRSSGLPAPGGAGYVKKSGQYAYIAAIKPDDSSMTYATYLGGSGTDGASGVALVPGRLWLIGQTTSANFPTVNPTQPSNAGGFDAWVAFLTIS